MTTQENPEEFTVAGAEKGVKFKNRKNRHQLLRGRPQGVWHPDAVGVVRGYPRTEEAYAAQVERCRANRETAAKKGLLTRRGVPNGWAGKKDELGEIRRNSSTEAERLTENLLPFFQPDNIQSAICFRELMKIVVDRTYHVRDRLRAMRIILEFTVAKPTARKIMRREAPLEFFQELAEAAQEGRLRGD